MVKVAKLTVKRQEGSPFFEWTFEAETIPTTFYNEAKVSLSTNYFFICAFPPPPNYSNLRLIWARLIKQISRHWMGRYTYKVHGCNYLVKEVESNCYWQGKVYFITINFLLFSKFFPKKYLFLPLLLFFDNVYTQQLNLFYDEFMYANIQSWIHQDIVKMLREINHGPITDLSWWTKTSLSQWEAYIFQPHIWSFCFSNEKLNPTS